MPNFLFQAKSPGGGRVTGREDGADLAGAKAALVRRGYSEIEFLESDNADDIRQMTRSGSGVSDRQRRNFTPADEAKSREVRGIWMKLVWLYGKNLVILGPLFWWNKYSLTRAGPLTRFDLAGFACTVGYLGWFAVAVAPTLCYTQLLRAAVWMDWATMRRYIRIARAARRILGRGIPEFEMKTREAYALAAEGDLPAALELMEEVRVTIPVKPHLYLGRLASVYKYAGLIERQMACAGDAFEAGPKRGLEWADLAMLRARDERDIPGAKAALAEALKFELSRVVKAGVMKCSGMVSISEHDYTNAEIELRGAISILGAVGNPVAGLIEAETKAYLCIACAGLGRTDEARRLWKEVGPLLRARREDWLIRRCTGALGLA